MKHPLPLLVSLLSSLAWAHFAQANTTGQQAFEVNCHACHDLQKDTVGPALIEIRKLYPIENQASFLAWTNNPGKKRPEGMQMPAMAHLGETKLKEIHQYILAISKDVKPKRKSRHNFTFKPAPKTYPYYQRGKMPFSSPAAIGIVFQADFGLSWDTATSRLNYAYQSKRSFFSGENKQNELLDSLIYQETADQLWSFAKDKPAIFKGYRLIDELPEFVYQVADITITERFSAIKNKLGFVRHITMVGVKQPITMDLSHTGKVKLAVSTGKLEGNKLHLSPAQAINFTVTVEVTQ
ncbi:c-type cytochrome [Paraglaciecola sp. L3A3]|uniref:c-type cytochrome n=1 Tax=Paraglaciecola sp. L3A3 TaxID=2686358 RepID=UPI00131E1C11|nr:cytochrome c [Paraglaciecola sp. L3A3]